MGTTGITTTIKSWIERNQLYVSFEEVPVFEPVRLRMDVYGTFIDRKAHVGHLSGAEGHQGFLYAFGEGYTVDDCYEDFYKKYHGKKLQECLIGTTEIFDIDEPVPAVVENSEPFQLSQILPLLGGETISVRTFADPNADMSHALRVLEFAVDLGYDEIAAMLARSGLLTKIVHSVVPSSTYLNQLNINLFA